MIAIDSMILVYAQRVPAKSGTISPETEDLRLRSKMLLYKFAHEKKPPTVVLPLIALSEVLIPVPTSQRPQLIATLATHFVLAPFDQQASAIAAELWCQARKLPSEYQYEKRHVLRADTLIVASAKAAGATEFYTNDDKCRELAKLVMKGLALPTDDPDDMYLKEDIRRGEV